MGKTVIEMRDIVKTYYIGTPNELEVLHGISLDIQEGEFVSIVGASGSGKSTLMNIIGALDHQTSGEYTLDGVPMAEMSNYAIELRAMTQSRGSFTFHFVRYEDCPPAAQQKAIDEAKAMQEE